jgi:hypothetical protein
MELQAMSQKQLRQVAKSLGIKGYGNLGNVPLRALITKHQQPQEAKATRKTGNGQLCVRAWLVQQAALGPVPQADAMAYAASISRSSNTVRCQASGLGLKLNAEGAYTYKAKAEAA